MVGVCRRSPRDFSRTAFFKPVPLMGFVCRGRRLGVWPLRWPAVPTRWRPRRTLAGCFWHGRFPVVVLLLVCSRLPRASWNSPRVSACRVSQHWRPGPTTRVTSGIRSAMRCVCKRLAGGRDGWRAGWRAGEPKALSKQWCGVLLCRRTDCPRLGWGTLLSSLCATLRRTTCCNSADCLGFSSACGGTAGESEGFASE